MNKASKRNHTVRTTLITSLLLICLTLLSAPETYAMRCGNNLVDEGATKAEVISKCGDPAFREEIGADSDIISDSAGTRREHRYVEEWTYNFGSTRFIYILTIKSGKVVKIRTESRGY
jgi:hypothetical protein